MAISNNSTGLRPGVCTSTTRPTAPYEGQHIYETDTDLTYIWGGSAWQQVSGGTAVGNSGLVYITNTAISGSSVTVSNCFNSTYDWYKVVFFITGTVTGADINIRMRTTSDDSGSVYSFSRIYGYSQTSSPTNQALELQTSGYVGTQENRGGNVQMDIYGPNAAQYTSIQSQNTGNKNAQPYAFQNLTGMTVSTTTQYTGFSLISSQTMTGSLTVYGYRK